MVTLTRFFGKHSHLHVSPIKSNKGHTFHVIKSQNQTIRLLLFIFYHTIRVLKKYLLIINQTEREKETREKEKLKRERNHLCPPPPLVFVPTANNMQPKWVRTQNCFLYIYNLFWLLIPLVWREKLCFVIQLGFVFCSNCDFVVHWEKAEISYAMLNSFFYSSCLILLVEEENERVCGKKNKK